ncbi:GIY-YIG nuclease family protein [Aspergillus fischeri NRRL 181]|uniref:Bacteriophage T5 Orf172 DNA-binding domain-containing protein n=1 Tax=Neosartorya fischeri (strain ATCC 1020 / DSM 3700 / CBS 544.65 / FGSC A1164 / JCM 1740 / NRRL 181 / WB 181) TaxID=331117 RepID=A1DD68_NEOFI|nr:conserved hypothetical protein [Aspergillus fischeri NRRL 181]EAW17325.1 conserved hypothetical protein [Aspergillus fischeri NRRL 181]KAG2014515.1 hypothetical protein GB937_006742 [Aspergillus fischeri]
MFPKSNSAVVALPPLNVPELRKATTTIHPSPPNSPSPAISFDDYKAKSELKDGAASRTEPSILLTPPTSPPRGMPELTNDVQPEGNAVEFDPPALKSLLSLDTGRCGCPTKQKQPCKMRIAEKKKAKIDKMIKSILGFIPSSPELEGEIENLAKLVHCWYHDHGQFITSRAEEWISTIPTGDPGNKPFLSLERQIRKALDGLSTQCIGKTQAQGNCCREIGGQKAQNCTSTINEIVYSATDLDDDDIEHLLKVLEHNRLCDRHDRQPLRHVELWKSRIMEIHSICHAQCAKLAEDTPPSASQKRVVLTARTSRLSPLRLNINPAEYWPAAYDVSPFSIIERSDRLNDYELSYKQIAGQARSPLNAKLGDLKDGYVYMYEVEGNDGFVKIGYTSRTTDERHKEWAFACNRAPKLLYPNSSNPQKVPNARRVEALCHAELHHRRLRIYCTGCLKQHIEWFEIAAADAIAVISKWSNWMASNPYQEKNLRAGSRWVLKTEEAKRFDDIKTFLKDISRPVPIR